MSHPPYATDLAPNVFGLFRHPKKLFYDDNEIKQASESYLESMQQELYLTGIKMLFDKCNMCIGVKGDYVE